MSLRVCVDARLITGLAGGVEQALIGLATGLKALEDDTAIHYLTFPGNDGWLRDHIGPHDVLLHTTAAPFHRSLKGRLKSAVPGLGALLERLPAAPGFRRSGPERSDGVIEDAGIEVMHFPHQVAFTTEIPTIYQPFDLQHLHLPHLFTPRERQFRDSTYRLHCDRASAVVVMTSWARRDLIEHLDLTPEKVRVIPLGPATAAYDPPNDEQVQAVARRHALPDTFALYPAQTWPHKNHLGLLEALASLRDRSLEVPLICTGIQNEYFETIARRIDELRLGDQVRFLGFLPPVEMYSLYRLARCLVFPSLFEGWALPICEAFDLKVPVACSNVTSLPDLVGNAALVFDPHDREAIAAAIARLWEDEGTRSNLIGRGVERASHFDWVRTAKTFGALYREVAGKPLTPGDRLLLAGEPLV